MTSEPSSTSLFEAAPTPVAHLNAKARRLEMSAALRKKRNRRWAAVGGSLAILAAGFVSFFTFRNSEKPTTLPNKQQEAVALNHIQKILDQPEKVDLEKLTAQAMTKSPEVRSLVAIIASRQDNPQAGASPEQAKTVTKIAQRIHKMPISPAEEWVGTHLAVTKILEKDPVLSTIYQEANRALLIRTLMDSRPLKRARDDAASMAIGSYQLVSLERGAR